MFVPSSCCDTVLVLPVFIGKCGIGGRAPLARGVASPGGGGYKTTSSVPPVRPDAEEARDGVFEPPMAGMALEAALAVSLFASPARFAGPYELLPSVELLLRFSEAESGWECVVGGENP